MIYCSQSQQRMYIWEESSLKVRRRPAYGCKQYWQLAKSKQLAVIMTSKLVPQLPCSQVPRQLLRQVMTSCITEKLGGSTRTKLSSRPTAWLWPELFPQKNRTSTAPVEVPTKLAPFSAFLSPSLTKAAGRLAEPENKIPQNRFQMCLITCTNWKIRLSIKACITNQC